jgi:hypothetical protein
MPLSLVELRQNNSLLLSSSLELVEVGADAPSITPIEAIMIRLNPIEKWFKESDLSFLLTLKKWFL